MKWSQVLQIDVDIDSSLKCAAHKQAANICRAIQSRESILANRQTVANPTKHNMQQ